jgi:hypothetical protein
MKIQSRSEMVGNKGLWKTFLSYEVHGFGLSILGMR